MEVEDLYKLILQGTMGSEHAISSIDTARSWLRRELASLPEGPEEPIADVISSDGNIVRINLRPFIQSGGDPSSLLDAFVRTGNEYRGTEERLRDHWSLAVRMAEDGELPFEPLQMGAFLEKMERDGFPAIHHSTRYEEAYHPAYRVIKQEYLESL
jgi:hypothetical protein